MPPSTTTHTQHTQQKDRDLPLMLVVGLSDFWVWTLDFFDGTQSALDFFAGT